MKMIYEDARIVIGKLDDLNWVLVPKTASGKLNPKRRRYYGAMDHLFEALYRKLSEDEVQEHGTVTRDNILEIKSVLEHAHQEAMQCIRKVLKQCVASGQLDGRIICKSA